jgi:hypothetical protein
MGFGSVDEPGTALSHVDDVALTDSTVLVLEPDPIRIASQYGYSIARTT